MTVESTQNRVDIVATDGQTSFGFSFKYFEADDISVFVNGVEVTTGFDVNPSPQGVNFGGTVVFTTGRTAGDQVALVRILDITQESDYEENDRLPSQQLEDDLDRQTMINQQQQEALRRRPQLAASSLVTDVVIEEPTAEIVGRAFVWRQRPDDTFFLGTSDTNVDLSLAGLTTAVAAATAQADLAEGSATAAAQSAQEAAQSAQEAAASNTNINNVESDVVAQGNTQVQRIRDQGDTEDTRVETEGNTQVARVEAAGQNIVNVAASVNIPPGIIAWFADDAVPTGWLYCNGQAVDRTVYSGLFAAIGTSFGTGDGVDTFNVPDLRGEFLRGYDDRTSGTRTFGTHQDDGAPNIVGTLDSIRRSSDGRATNDTGAIRVTRVTVNGDGGESRPGYDMTFDASRVSGVYQNGVTELRPDNTVLLPCIRAFGAVTADTIDADAIVSTLNALRAEITNEGDRVISELRPLLNQGSGITTQITDAGTAQVNAVNSAGTNQVNLVNQAGVSQVGRVASEGNSQFNRISQEGDDQVAAVQSAGATQTTGLQTTGNNFINQISSQGNTQVTRLTELETSLNAVIGNGQTISDNLVIEGNAQVARVTAEGTSQVNLVEDEGDDQVARVNTAGTTQTDMVNTAGTTQTAAVNTAGTTQVGLVNSEGTTQVAAVRQEGTDNNGLLVSTAGAQVSNIISAGDAQVTRINNAGLPVPTTGDANLFLGVNDQGEYALEAVMSGTGGISDIILDTTPQLGGNLDVNGRQILSTSGDVVINPAADLTVQGDIDAGSNRISAGSADIGSLNGFVTALNGLLSAQSGINLSNLNQSAAANGQVITWNGSAWVAQTPASGGGTTTIPITLSRDTPDQATLSTLAAASTNGNTGLWVVGNDQTTAGGSGINIRAQGSIPLFDVDGTQIPTSDTSKTNHRLRSGTIVRIFSSTSLRVLSTPATGGGGGMSDVVDDTSPQLGGNLDTNGRQIFSTNTDITINPGNGARDLIVNGDIRTSQGRVSGRTASFSALGTGIVQSAGGSLFTRSTLPLSSLEGSGASNGQVPQWNGSRWVPATVSGGGGTTGISNIVEDTSPQLGGDLFVNGHDITSDFNQDVTINPGDFGQIVLDAETTSSFKLTASSFRMSGSGSGVVTQTGTGIGQRFVTTTDLDLSNLASGGATNGQVMTYNGSNWAPAAAGGGGGGVREREVLSARLQAGAWIITGITPNAPVFIVVDFLNVSTNGEPRVSIRTSGSAVRGGQCEISNRFRLSIDTITAPNATTNCFIFYTSATVARVDLAYSAFVGTTNARFIAFH